MNIIAAVVDLSPVTDGLSDVGVSILSAVATVIVAALGVGGLAFGASHLLRYFRDLCRDPANSGDYQEPGDVPDYRNQPNPEQLSADTSMFAPNGDDVRAG